MEITTLSDASVKIKGKHTTLAINPRDIRSKISVAAALFFERLVEPISPKHFEEEPLIIQGPGDYEIGGVKIVGSRGGESFTYRIIVDGITILSAKTSSLAKSKESTIDYDLLLLEADSLADQSVVTALNPSVIVFYGTKKTENAKAMGKEETPISKFSMAKEKLPSETQIVMLQ